jgi:hypothetical protein
VAAWPNLKTLIHLMTLAKTARPALTALTALAHLVQNAKLAILVKIAASK